MARFRKKPVVIEAVQFVAVHQNEGCVRAVEMSENPNWFLLAQLGGAIKVEGEGLRIETLEGDHFASPGDWIIRGVKGELYPCKPEIFAMTYEQAE